MDRQRRERWGERVLDAALEAVCGGLWELLLQALGAAGRAVLAVLTGL